MLFLPFRQAARNVDNEIIITEVRRKDKFSAKFHISYISKIPYFRIISRPTGF